MESRTKKMIPSEGINGFEDRLSDLPDNLIVHILSFMPTLYAVKTMLLRRFGNLWTLVPTLTFDLWEYDQVIWPNEDDATNDEVFSSFARFIRNVVMLHKRRTIDSFHLSIKAFDVEFKDPKLIDDIQLWLRFAIDREVKDLNIYFDGDDDLVLPHCIFMSQSLITLTLYGCMLEHQPHVHMGTLRELSLVNVQGSGLVFNQVILGCPSLQELNINIFNLFHVLNITSPSVSKLCLEIYHPCLSITLSFPNMKNLDICVSGISLSFMVDVIDVSSLQVVNIKGLPYLSLPLIEAFLRQIRNVEVVTMSVDAFERLCWDTKIEFPQTRWKRLVLRSLRYDNKHVQVILGLVKNSVKLEELIIYNHSSSDDQEYGSLKSSTTSTYVMPLLKKVTIHDCGRFLEAQLQLVEVVLQNAVLLEQLVIRGYNRLTAVDQLNFVKQISNFRRGSTNATVIFD